MIRRKDFTVRRAAEGFLTEAISTGTSITKPAECVLIFIACLTPVITVPNREDDYDGTCRGYEMR